MTYDEMPAEALAQLLARVNGERDRLSQVAKEIAHALDRKTAESQRQLVLTQASQLCILRNPGGTGSYITRIFTN